MKMAWKKNPKGTNKKTRKKSINLPFEDNNSNTEDTNPTSQQPLREAQVQEKHEISISHQEDIYDDDKRKNLAHEFEALGNKYAEEGKYRQALGKWESAITLLPERAVLHEQKAQLLLELEETWSALKAATRATELEPKWAEGWVTLGRAQLNYGEPDCAIESFDKALAIKPDSIEARDDRQSALHLVKRRKQLHITSSSPTRSHFLVGDGG